MDIKSQSIRSKLQGNFQKLTKVLKKLYLIDVTRKNLKIVELLYNFSLNSFCLQETNPI